MKAARMQLHQLRLFKGALTGVSFVVLLMLAGCNPTQLQTAGVRTDPNVVNESLLGKAYVYEDDPINATGKSSLPSNFNISKIVGKTPQSIVPLSKTTLTNDCLFQQEQYIFGTSSTYSFVDCLLSLIHI